MRTTRIAVLLGLAMIGTSIPVGAAEIGPNGARLTAVLEQVKAAPFVLSGKKLPSLVKAAVKAMPKEQQSAVDDVYVIDDLEGFVQLFGLSNSESSDMLQYLRAKDAFAFVGRTPLFINGSNPTFKAFQNAYAQGDSIPVRLLRARLSHEALHANGQSLEAPCYKAELDLLEEDKSHGRISGASADAYVSQVRAFYNAVATVTVASAK